MFSLSSQRHMFPWFQGAYYFRPAATAESTDKWVFSLQVWFLALLLCLAFFCQTERCACKGGGECVTEEECAARALTNLGSSTNYAADGSQFMIQYQDGAVDRNPEFYSWNHVFVMYCTGDLHFGSVAKPGPMQWGWAHFSGSLIVDSVVEDCKSMHGLGNATIVVWSGDSGGGIGSLASVDRVASMVPSAKVFKAYSL